MLILQQMTVLFVIMIIGYFASRKHILDEDTCKKISFIVVNIANPAMILSSVSGESKIDSAELTITMLISVGMFACLMLLAAVVPVVLKIEQKQYGVYRLMTVFSNIGFMGFPIISAIYGKDALLYASVFLLPYNILLYTYGILTIDRKTPEEKQRSRKDNDKAPFWESLKKICNIGVVASLGALVIYFGNIQIPGMVIQVIEMLANLTAPLSMMVIGASFTSISVKDMAADVKLLVFSVLKLLVVPILGMLVLAQIVENSTLLGICLIMLATPVGSTTAMLAQQYDCESELASRGVALTTLLSVGTIPLVSAVCSLFL